jgi:hypothetical protein
VNDSNILYYAKQNKAWVIRKTNNIIILPNSKISTPQEKFLWVSLQSEIIKRRVAEDRADEAENTLESRDDRSYDEYESDY